MKNTELEQLINEKLNSAAISDYAPNGLQVEGKETVQKIVTGVTASQALLDEAVRLGADAVIVHHGYFWKGESPVIRGMKRNRLKTLLANDINLYGWHLPLDAHPELGNNAQLAALLGITVMGEIEPLVPWGELTMPVPGLELASWIEARLGRKPLWCGDTGPEVVQRVAWCTGGGQSFIDSAARFGVDAFITGEVSEQTIHSAREQGLHFYAAGHHATERGDYISRERWLELWQLATGDQFITQVDVRKAKSNDLKEVYELAKYSAKDTDYLVSRPVFEIFYKALKGKQILVFSGLFKDAHKMYKLGELDIYKKQSDIEYVYKLYYNWYKNEYENTKCIELTEEEKRKINKKLIDEFEID